MNSKYVDVELFGQMGIGKMPYTSMFEVGVSVSVHDFF